MIKKPYIELDSLEQLMEFIKDVGVEVIVNEDTYTITIYDGYME